MDETPEVTVLMSVFNGGKHLKEAVESILKQTFANFEFLIIDDGSTDDTWQTLIRWSDPRMRLIRNEHNLGLIASLNKGLKAARGDFIARLDSDDIALPRRLQEQKKFLERHRNFAMVGTWVEVIDESGRTIDFQKFVWEPCLVRWQLLFKTPFVHSAVMMRRSFALETGGYHQDFKFAEDYELWSRLGSAWEIGNIPQVLVKRRERRRSVSNSNRQKQIEVAQIISQRNLEKILEESIDRKSFLCLRALYLEDSSQIEKGDLSSVLISIDKLLLKFIERYKYHDTHNIKNINVDVATHMLTCIKKRFIHFNLFFSFFVWLRRFYPYLLRMVIVFLFKKTQLGIRLYKNIA